MLAVNKWVVSVYEVKIRDMPIKAFLQEDKAIEYIEQNKRNFLYFRKIEHAILKA